MCAESTFMFFKRIYSEYSLLEAVLFSWTSIVISGTNSVGTVLGILKYFNKQKSAEAEVH